MKIADFGLGREALELADAEGWVIGELVREELEYLLRCRGAPPIPFESPTGLYGIEGVLAENVL